MPSSSSNGRPPPFFDSCRERLAVPGRERLAVPGQADRVLWVGSDATKSVFSATEYGEKLYSWEETADFWPALVAAAGEADEDLIVSISELLGRF